MPDDAAIAAMILQRLATVRTGGTICPSDVARALADDWRPLMPEVRRVAAEMSDINIFQKGRIVDPRTARGPIRLGSGRAC